jgi:hypothetical protein
VVDKQLASASYTYKLMVFSTKLPKTISTKAFLDEQFMDKAYMIAFGAKHNLQSHRQKPFHH